MTLAERDINCDNLAALVVNQPLVKDCDRLKNGSIRLKTLFQYPNGSFIDVVLERLDESRLKLSDYGTTAEFLIDVGVNAWVTKNRQLAVREICEGLGIRDENKELELVLPAPSVTSDEIARLAQACIRVSSLLLTKRYRSVSSFRDDFEEGVLVDVKDYESDVELTGKYGNLVKIDFRVAGRSSTSLVQTIDTQNPVTAHSVANEVFTKWFDLGSRPDYQYLTVFSSDSNAVRREDIDRLREYSAVMAFPAEQDGIRALLAA